MSKTGKLWLLTFVFCTGTWKTPNWACAQGNDSDLPDSPSAVARSEHGADSPSEREVSWRTLPRDFLNDQKDIWLFPGQLAKGRHWIPTLAITGVTAGLIAADPHVMPYFRSHAGRLDDLNDVFDAPITTAETIALPASLMLAGYIRHDQYAVSTALLAGEGYADSAIVDLGVKAITPRKTPSRAPPRAPFYDTFFCWGKSPFKCRPFPSAH